MKAKTIFSLCGNGGSCPTIFQNDDGDYIIQGYVLQSDEKAPLKAPEGEDIVRLPKEFVKAMVKDLKV